MHTSLLLIVLILRPCDGRLLVDHVDHVPKALFVFIGEGAHLRAVDVQYCPKLAIAFVAAGDHDLRPSVHVARYVVLKLLSVVSDQTSLLCSTLTALARAHFDLAARENVLVRHILTNENLLIVVRLLVVEAYEAELF